MAKRRRLSDPRDVSEVLTDSQTAGDERLMEFLQHVSVRTRVYAGAARFTEELDAAGLTTWFDVEELEAGDDFDLKIRRNIGRCAFFVPVISATTERRHEAWFRHEWNCAIDRTRRMATARCFSCRSSSTTPTARRHWYRH